MSDVTSSAATPGFTDAPPTGAAPRPWWRNAVLYQIYPRSFADSNGDGVGDLGGVRDKLGYLELLGVDALWLSPVMRAPMVDHGSGNSDPRDIDPQFGSLEVFDALVAEAHARSIRVSMDLVPNHTSESGQWCINLLEVAHGLAKTAGMPDELMVAVNLRLTETAFDAAALRKAVDDSFAASAGMGTTPTWTLSNHNVVREVTRYGDGEVGLARARAMALFMLGLPGVASIYNGSELGLPNVDLPDWALQDPVWERSGHTERGHDGCRVPIPWEGRTPPFGFGHAPTSWLPIPPEWVDRTVENQLEDVGSMLNLYRSAIAMRTHRPEFDSTGIDWYGSPPGCLAYRTHAGLICALNTTNRPIALPPGAVLLASTPVVNGQLGGNSAAWMV